MPGQPGLRTKNTGLGPGVAMGKALLSQDLFLPLFKLNSHPTPHHSSTTHAWISHFVFPSWGRQQTVDKTAAVHWSCSESFP